MKNSQIRHNGHKPLYLLHVLITYEVPSPVFFGYSLSYAVREKRNKHRLEDILLEVYLHYLEVLVLLHLLRQCLEEELDLHLGHGEILGAIVIDHSQLLPLTSETFDDSMVTMDTLPRRRSVVCTFSDLSSG